MNVNGVQDMNGLEGRQAMEKQNSWTLTRRGWIALVVVPVFMLVAMFTYATRDVCYVGQPDGNWLGYGSCSKMIDKILEEEGK